MLKKEKDSFRSDTLNFLEKINWDFLGKSSRFYLEGFLRVDYALFIGSNIQRYVYFHSKRKLEVRSKHFKTMHIYVYCYGIHLGYQIYHDMSSCKCPQSNLYFVHLCVSV